MIVSGECGVLKNAGGLSLETGHLNENPQWSVTKYIVVFFLNLSFRHLLALEFVRHFPMSTSKEVSSVAELVRVLRRHRGEQL